jgi:hypothetical protein
LAQEDAIDHDSLRELEGHLRDVIDAEMASGTLEEDAFSLATDQLGQRVVINEEYEKVHTHVPWQRRLFVILVGFMVVTTIYDLIPAALILSEMVLVKFGVMGTVPLPKPFPIDLNSPLSYRLVPEGVTSINRISLALIGSRMIYVILSLLVPMLAFLLIRRSYWKPIDNLVAWCGVSRARMVGSILALGTVHAITGYRGVWLSKFSPYNRPDFYGDLGMEQWEYLQGSLVFGTQISIISSLGYLLLVGIVLHTYRRSRFLGITHSVATALWGYVIVGVGMSCLAVVRMFAALISSYFALNHSLSLGGFLFFSTIEVFAAIALVAAMGLAMTGHGFVKFGQLLRTIWHRPVLVGFCWAIVHLCPNILGTIVYMMGADMNKTVIQILVAGHTSIFHGWILSLTMTVVLLVLVLARTRASFSDTPTLSEA